MNTARPRGFVGTVLVLGLAGACSGAGSPLIGPPTDPTEGGADAGDDAREGSTHEAGGGSSSGGGACSSCSTDQDCQAVCAPPTQANYVWCCGSSTCYQWSTTCPVLDAGH